MEKHTKSGGVPDHVNKNTSLWDHLLGTVYPNSLTQVQPLI